MKNTKLLKVLSLVASVAAFIIASGAASLYTSKIVAATIGFTAFVIVLAITYRQNT